MALASIVANMTHDARQILANPHCSKLSTLARYLKLTVKASAAKRGLLGAPTAEKIGAFRVACHSYEALRSIWREVYGCGPCYFPAAGRSPAILDAGSNIGMTVLYFLELYPDARITAFEPDPDTFRLLSANIEANGLNKRVELVNAAVFSHSGELAWHSGEPGSLSSSLLARENLPKAAVVPCVRLSDYVKERIDLLKLDVEGVESAVLAELEQSGAIARIDRMIIEYHSWAGTPRQALVDLLARNGFTETPSRFPHMIYVSRRTGAGPDTHTGRT